MTSSRELSRGDNLRPRALQSATGFALPKATTRTLPDKIYLRGMLCEMKLSWASGHAVEGVNIWERVDYYVCLRKKY